MSSCRDIEPLVTPYVDGDASPSDRAAVASHLEACSPCRRLADHEAAARTVVRARAAALQAATPAPPSLRAACTPAAAPTPRQAARTMLPWALAASVLAAAVVLFTLTTRSTTLLAAQLTVDHVKCFEFPGTPAPDARALEAKLASIFGWHMTVPPGSTDANLSLLTARRCLYADGRVAHLMYRHHDRPVSLFVLPNTERVPEEVRVMGHEAIVWSLNRKAYVLIGREPRAELEELAAYVRTTLTQQEGR